MIDERVKIFIYFLIKNYPWRHRQLGYKYCLYREIISNGTETSSCTYSRSFLLFVLKVCFYDEFKGGCE